MPMELRARQVEVEDDLEAAFQEYYGRGWTDGLPITPPTPERVMRMIEGAGRPAPEVVAILPPRNAPATVESVAINAVMAGCQPSYFPVVLAIVEAMGEPSLDLFGLNATTNHVWLLSVVNGPVRSKLDINCSYGVMGPGWRANATIGRAVRLVQLNIAGARPGEISKSTHGHPGRYTACIGEYEEKNPWGPLHVEKGFQPQESTVAVMGATTANRITDTGCRTADGLLHVLANCMITPATAGHPDSRSMLLLCPDHATVLAREGLSKEDAKRELYQRTRSIPLSLWPKELLEGDPEHMARVGTHRPTVANGVTSLHADPSHFEILVAGGLGGYHSTWFTLWALGTVVLQRIKAPPGM